MTLRRGQACLSQLRLNDRYLRVFLHSCSLIEHRRLDSHETETQRSTTVKRFPIPLLLGSLLLALAGLFLGHLSPHAVAASPRQPHGLSPSTCNRTWSVVGSPNDSRGSNSLQSIAAISSTDVWAVGNVYIMYSRSTLVQHWNGTTLSI